MTTAEMHQRVATLQSEYARCIDDDQLERWPEFFADDCLYKVTTAANYDARLDCGIIYADSKGMLVDRVSALRQANIYERQRYRHVVGGPLVSVEGSGAIRVQSPFLVTRIMRDGRMDLFACGRYLDRICENPDGELRFRERIVVCDSARFDTLLALPL